MSAEKDIEPLPAPLPQPSRDWMYWLAAAVLAIVLLGAIVVGLDGMDRAPNWDKEPLAITLQNLAQTARPIVETSLERRGLWKVFGAWRNLPFHLTYEEQTAVRQCMQLALRKRSLHNGVLAFEAQTVRAGLQSLLQKNETLFYAAFLLGDWHRIHGNATEAERYHKLAYTHAPIVLIQRFQHADGSPLTGAAIQELTIEYNRVVAGSLDPSLQLCYTNLTTDEEGCVYVPVYDTVYRRFSISHPTGYEVSVPRLGWFETARSVAELPPVTVAPTLEN